ncbi:hypothetical protein SAMN05421739_11044 [Pontibacter chinhatensis]|uniref:Uncharacterized protein n=1 Tax=Pontibacter chinhatensis TaxID=1436961 RepID=A0A1I2YWL4_9BACT|nr:hypothetical protein SAMN05421739_11044 [Pontibacter chinhatensis]
MNCVRKLRTPVLVCPQGETLDFTIFSSSAKILVL